MLMLLALHACAILMSVAINRAISHEAALRNVELQEAATQVLGKRKPLTLGFDHCAIQLVSVSRLTTLCTYLSASHLSFDLTGSIREKRLDPRAPPL